MANLWQYAMHKEATQLRNMPDSLETSMNNLADCEFPEAIELCAKDDFYRDPWGDDSRTVYLFRDGVLDSAYEVTLELEPVFIATPKELA